MLGGALYVAYRQRAEIRKIASNVFGDKVIAKPVVKPAICPNPKDVLGINPVLKNAIAYPYINFYSTINFKMHEMIFSRAPPKSYIYIDFGEFHKSTTSI